MQRFLGLVNYYRDFIKDLAKIGRPLYAIKDKGVLEWTPEREKTFKEVKEAVVDLPYRVLWDPTKKIRMRTDASEHGLGIVLEQEEEGGWWPIAFHSRVWHPNEEHWSTHHLEMVAFVEGLQKWRHYVMDRKIVAQTDSKFVERTNTQKATANRLARWWEVFAEYNVEFQHIKGKTNIVADALSRSPIECRADTMEQAHVFVTMVQQQMRFEYGGIKNLQQGI